MNQTVTLIGKGQKCKTPARVILSHDEYQKHTSQRPETVRFNQMLLQWQAHCPRCTDAGHWIWLLPIQGKVVAEKKCDGRCMSATGGTCECQCGGENHGANHSL